MDRQSAAGLLSLNQSEEVVGLGSPSVVLGPDQEIDAGALAPFVKEFEEVSASVHDRDHPGMGHLPGHSARVPEAPDPGVGVFLLDGDLVGRPRVLLRAALRCPALGAEHPQRKTLGGHDQGGVGVQAPALGSRLVGADHAQPFAFGQIVVVEVGAVLDAQHRLLGLHTLLGPFPVGGQDVVHRHGRVLRLVDEPVVALHRSPVSLGNAREGTHGVVCLHACAPHQSLAQAAVAQRGAAELVFGPGPGLQAGLHRKRAVARVGRQSHPLAEVVDQRIEVHILDRLWLLALPVLATPPLGRAHPDPGARPKTRRSGPGRIDKALDPRTDQQTAEAHYPVQVPPARLHIPANPAIPGPKLERGRREPHRPEPAVFGAHEVAELTTHERPRSPGMFPGQQLVPQPHLRLRGHRHELQAPDSTRAPGYRLRQRDRLAEPARLPGVRARSRDR